MRWDFLSLLIASGSAILGLILVITRVDPYKAEPNHLILFYFSFIISVWSTVMLLSYITRRALIKNYIHEQLFASSFFHGMVAAFIAVATLLVYRFLN